MPALLPALAAVYGVLAGTLLPRAAHRLAVAPGEPWRTACPQGHLLTGPAYGWLGAARCLNCPPPAARWYGPSTPLLATVTALLCAALAAATGPRPELAVWLALVPFGVLLAAVDHAVHRLPDLLTLPLAAAALTLLGAAAALDGAGGSWPGALLGGLALGGTYFLLFLAHPSGMGFGDVKLALALGIALGWYGWGVLILGFTAGVGYGGAHALTLVLRGRASRRTAMPLGPSMLAGTATGLLCGALLTSR
ncbi:prepilin peptidase [Streptomyces boluensis]|uniref:Prepilin peptidase n=1 Tax=Streptomyces boluensis TaxID=1775135 RepID=A0A964UWW8_9ACTN|nr:A24 family peptidase [Streptomyces boluensis]NBE55783.1 prepilin peptidase [Streptomyces boluensis]